ncbi:hypothetical protein AURDEDRAFT_160539 [Auricularia subglabra TFB-10046 SS5]|nr:hypothetical protein AURDEDRAFT_160539 [Auricularia subglabra TFB-10046 SS5]
MDLAVVSFKGVPARRNRHDFNSGPIRRAGPDRLISNDTSPGRHTLRQLRLAQHMRLDESNQSGARALGLFPVLQNQALGGPHGRNLAAAQLTSKLNYDALLDFFLTYLMYVMRSFLLQHHRSCLQMTVPHPNHRSPKTPRELSIAKTNAPVRAYKYELGKLLKKLDEAETTGVAGIRKERKRVVELVEGALGELERKIAEEWKKAHPEDEVMAAKPVDAEAMDVEYVLEAETEVDPSPVLLFRRELRRAESLALVLRGDLTCSFLLEGTCTLLLQGAGAEGIGPVIVAVDGALVLVLLLGLLVVPKLRRSGGATSARDAIRGVGLVVIGAVLRLHAAQLALGEGVRVRLAGRTLLAQGLEVAGAREPVHQTKPCTFILTRLRMVAPVPAHKFS